MAEKGHGMDARGFTLIEILIAVAIVGVLSAAALVNHAVTVQRARFDAARAVLLQIYAGEQQFLMSQGTFVRYFPTTGSVQPGCASGNIVCNNIWRNGLGMDAPLVPAPVLYQVEAFPPAVAGGIGSFIATATYNGQIQTIDQNRAFGAGDTWIRP